MHSQINFKKKTAMFQKQCSPCVMNLRKAQTTEEMHRHWVRGKDNQLLCVILINLHKYTYTLVQTHISSKNVLAFVVCGWGSGHIPPNMASRHVEKCLIKLKWFETGRGRKVTLVVPTPTLPSLKQVVTATGERCLTPRGQEHLYL